MPPLGRGSKDRPSSVASAHRASPQAAPPRRTCSRHDLWCSAQQPFDVREFAKLSKQGRLLLSVERSPGELIGAPIEVREQSGRLNENPGMILGSRYPNAPERAWRLSRTWWCASASWPSFAFAAGDPDRGFRVVVPRASVSRARGRHRATCSSISGVSGVSGALGNECASVVVSTDKPVFSDDSGIRAAVLKWGVWAICLIAVLLGGALVLTLRTHVALPGVDRLPPPRGQIGRAAVSPPEESSQPPQPSITVRPSITFRPTDAKPSPTVKRAAPTVKRAAPTADATSAAPTRTRTPAGGATASAQETTMVRNPKAANPTPRGSRPTSKPGNGPG